VVWQSLGRAHADPSKTGEKGEEQRKYTEEAIGGVLSGATVYEKKTARARKSRPVPVGAQQTKSTAKSANLC